MARIRIHYEIFGALKSAFRDNSGSLDIPEEMTLGEFLVRTAGLEESHLKYLDVTVDGKRLPFSSRMKENMKVRILMPIGGG